MAPSNPLISHAGRRVLRVLGYSPLPHSTEFYTQKRKIREIREKIFPATIEHLKAFNNQILTIRAEVNPQEEDLKQLYDVLHELQDAASSISILLSLTKDKIRIESSAEY